MQVEPLGELRPHEDVPEWLVSRPVKVGYFAGAELEFVLEDPSEDANPEELASAVRSFCELTVADRELATAHVHRNYAELVDAVGPEDVDVAIDHPGDVWDHVQPTAIHVSRRHRRDKKVYVQIVAECDWEPEHGLQIVYREGKHLCRVSSQDGHLTHTDAYDLPEDQDRIS